MKPSFLPAVLLLSLALLRPVPAQADDGCPGRLAVESAAMGSILRVIACPPLERGSQAPDAAAVDKTRAAIAKVQAEFQRLEQLWSTWIPASEISRLNAAAGKQPVAVGPETMAILQRARLGSEQTGGLFDVTFAPLGEVWKFDTPPKDARGEPTTHEPTRLHRVPTQAEVRERLARVGWKDLLLDPKAGTAFLRRPGMAVHLGGIGKGAAVDRAVALLRAHGLTAFAVQAGGDLYCAGLNGNRPWRVGIAHPRQKGALLGQVPIQDAAFSTSGDYERFAILDGRRYHHLLDTRTGWPAQASQSATVRAPTATDAEVLTKAAFVLGGKAGVALVEKLGGQAVIVDGNGTVFQSKALDLQDRR